MAAALLLMCSSAAAQERARPAGLDEARVEALLDTVVAEKRESHKVVPPRNPIRVGNRGFGHFRGQLSLTLPRPQLRSCFFTFIYERVGSCAWGRYR